MHDTLYYKVLILRNAAKNNNLPTFRWHLLNFYAPLLGYADLAQHTYHEYFYVRKWLWRARASWQAPDPWPGHARQTICPPASLKSTFRWCHTHSQYEKYVVVHLFLPFSYNSILHFLKSINKNLLIIGLFNQIYTWNIWILDMFPFCNCSFVNIYKLKIKIPI